MKRTLFILLSILLYTITCSVMAQQRIIRYEGGRKKVLTGADSLAIRDSLMKRDSIDTTFLVTKTELKKSKDTLAKPVKHKWNLTRDTIEAGKLTMLSLIPGLGQVYNRQYWKVPVIYGAIGGFVAGGLISSNLYNNARADWHRVINLNLPMEIRQDAQIKMENYNTARTAFYVMAAATYLYQVADATFNYRGKTDHVRKATIMAAAFPGAGFLYTKTYWRLPIYYGGFIVLGTVIDYNNRSYERYADAYNALTDADPGTVDEFNGRYTPEMLQNARNNYRRNRDFGIIAIVAAYVLSIVDTHVIASLKNWDVSPDLSMTVEPTVINNSIHGAPAVPSGAGLSLKLRF